MLELINETGVGAALVPGWDLAGHPCSVLVARLTLHFDLSGDITVAEKQVPPVLADSHFGKPMESSLQEANEIGSFKQGAEYYLQGRAYTLTGKENRAHVSVELRQQDFVSRKQLVVLGEHQWEVGLVGSKRGEPATFVSLPLRYEYAFGGAREEKGRREKKNPVGRGFNPDGWRVLDKRAPLIEYAGQSALSPSGGCPVAGLAPLPVFWSPRQERFGGLADNPMQGEGCPWGRGAMPTLHHCAPEDQWLPRPCAGGETLALQGLLPDHSQPVSLALPSWQPSALLIRRGHTPRRFHMDCDTLVVDTEQRSLALIARTQIDPGALGGQPGWLRLLAASSLEGGHSG